MKKIAIALAATAALTTSALAADLPAREPIYKAAPAPVWSWTGFYIGGNVGAGIGRNKTALTETELGVSLLADTQKMSPAGFIGGGQLGYNYQFAPHWLVGIEGDFQGSTQKDASCISVCSPIPAGFGALRVDMTQKLEWFATLRARLGYTNGDWLWYVTGGGAWAKIQNDLVATGSQGGNSSSDESSGSFTQSGWTVGGGVETHLWSNWTAKIEYLYMDLGSISAGPVAVSQPIAVSFAQTSEIRDHIVRVGLNYKFY